MTDRLRELFTWYGRVPDEPDVLIACPRVLARELHAIGEDRQLWSRLHARLDELSAHLAAIAAALASTWPYLSGLELATANAVGEELLVEETAQAELRDCLDLGQWFDAQRHAQRIVRSLTAIAAHFSPPSAGPVLRI